MDTLVDRFTSCPSIMTAIILEYLHGAATRIPADATAFPLREPAWNMLILSQWKDRAESDRNIAWTRETYDAMLPFTSQRQYVNYLSNDQLKESMSDVYGPNYERLRAVKRTYDPENVFHLNQNIAP
jgi:FAD/FMN-containing dehydrogenase